MNRSTLSLLCLAFATTSLAAHAAEKKADKKQEKKTTCMQELRKGKSVEANMTATLKCQERAIGRLALSGVLEEDSLRQVLEKQKAFDELYKDAMKDGKISSGEKKDLKKMKKIATEAVFETSWDQLAMEARMKKLKKQIEAGEKKGQLTEEETGEATRKYFELQALFNKLNSGGLTTEEKKELRSGVKELSKQIYDDRRDDEGAAAATADRNKDDIDELRRNQAARIVACFSEEKNTKNYKEQIEKLRALQKKEFRYLVDGSLSKDESTDLNQLYEQNSLYIAKECGGNDDAIKQARNRPDETGMRPYINKDKAKSGQKVETAQ